MNAPCSVTVIDILLFKMAKVRWFLKSTFGLVQSIVLVALLVCFGHYPKLLHEISRLHEPRWMCIDQW